MTRTFTQRVGAFLTEEFGHIADATLNRVSPASGKRWCFVFGQAALMSGGLRVFVSSTRITTSRSWRLSMQG
jgi:hypothetical protein